MVNKFIILNKFVLLALNQNNTHLSIITRKTTIEMDILKCRGKVEKSQKFKGGVKIILPRVVATKTQALERIW